MRTPTTVLLCPSKNLASANFELKPRQACEKTVS
jgi:hypothetical protein